MNFKRSKARSESGFVSLKSGLLIGGISAVALSFGAAAFAAVSPPPGMEGICVTTVFVDDPKFQAQKGFCGIAPPIVGEPDAEDKGFVAPGTGSIVDTWTSNDGQRIYVVKNGDKTLYRSHNGGSTWDEILLKNTPSYVDASDNGQIILTGRGSGNQVSLDGGDSWADAGAIPDGGVGMASVSADGSTMVIAEYKSTWDVFVSRDSGKTWWKERFATPPAGPQIVMNYIQHIDVSDNGKTIVVATEHDFSISRDGGVTWAPKNKPGFFYDHWVSDPFNVIVGMTGFSDDGQTIFSTIFAAGALSNDGGLTWNRVVSLPDRYFTSVHVSPDGNKIMATSDSKVYRSLDNGATWQSADLPLKMRDSEFSPNGEYLTNWSLNDKITIIPMLTNDLNWTEYTAK